MTKTDAMGGTAARDLTQTLLNALTIMMLMAVCLWVMRPFAGALVWATMIVVATWPLMLRAQRWFRGRRWAAVALMTVALLAVFVLPVLVAAGTLIANLDRMSAWLQSTVAAGLPGPPSWTSRVPLVGASIAEKWTTLAATPPAEIRDQVAPYGAAIVRWIAATIGTVGATLVHLLLIVLLSAILYTTGDTAAKGAIRLARRMGGASGEGAVRLAGQAVRAVALGVVVTALAQTLLAAIGLFVVGVPFAGALTAVILIFCIAQLGPLPVLGPSVAWLYWSGSPGWGTALLIWTLFVGTIDNVLRPVLIKRGADLPLLLVFAGVIGGLLGFGMVGLFVGPVVLAVTYTLTKAWVEQGEPSVPAAPEATALPIA